MTHARAHTNTHIRMRTHTHCKQAPAQEVLDDIGLQLMQYHSEVCTCVSMCTCVHVRMCVRACACMHACMRVYERCMHACMHVYELKYYAMNVSFLTANPGAGASTREAHRAGLA